MIMKKAFKSFCLIFLILFPQYSLSNLIVNDDLKESLEKLYELNPKLKYYRNILKSKDELMPQAYSEFRPEIRGYYEKGNGKDLGSILEFKSEIKVGLDIFENSKLSYSYSHISNNDWGDTNPGTDNQQITFSKNF